MKARSGSARVGLAVVGLAFLVGCGGGSEAGIDVAANAPAGAEAMEETSRAIPTQLVEMERLRAEIAASGTVEARRLTQLSAEVPGRILSVAVDVGDEVDEGAVLFQIDPGPYEMGVAEARAALRLARAESANAGAEAERMAHLVEQNAGSKQQLDQEVTKAEVSRARVAQMRARLDRANRDLEHTEVRAPYAGTIVERLAHEGAMAAGGPVLVMQESGELEAILDVPETTPVPVRVGDPARVWVEGEADPFTSEVVRVNRRVDPETRTYEVRVSLDDPSGTVKAGSYARAEFEPSRAEARPVVPRSALLTRDGRTHVLRVEDGVVEHVLVRVGIVAGDQAEILDGLEAGNYVVHGEAVRRLPDGAEVETRSTGEKLSASREEGDAS